MVGFPQSGGMEAVLQLPAKHRVWGSPDPCFMQIPASESLVFPFSLTEGAKSGRIWRNSQECVFVTEWAWSMGVVYIISVLSGEATLLHSSEVIACIMFRVMV